MRATSFTLVIGSMVALGPIAARADPGALPPENRPAKPLAEAAVADAALVATTAKLDAYVGYMKRSLQVVVSLQRYQLWVDMRTGPTGNERVVYGLHASYDLTDERAAVQRALAAPPSLPELDDAMRAYVAACDALSPVLVEADGYYSRGDYKRDGMVRGKALHKDIATLGDAFLAARARIDGAMRTTRTQRLALEMIRRRTTEPRAGPSPQ